jgi:hypothetical protein
MKTESDIQEELKKHAELVAEQKKVEKQNWLNSNAAKDFVDELKVRRDNLLTVAESLSVYIPPDTIQIQRNLIQAKTIQEVINKLLKI